MIKEMLLSYVSYNVWANERLTNAILQAGDAAADMEQKSSFSTIRKTLQHIYTSEKVWQSRLNNDVFHEQPQGGFPEKISELCRLLKENNASIRDYVSALTEEALQRKITYRNTKGVEYSNSIQEIIMHLVNHESYHRGQLVTMMRGAGHTAFEQMDYIAYLR
ncbi:MAG: DinB family protein [Bacteroidetes bacterium]|jgi:uncharacterized damage-inducible protein DinB|nr:DinB family protein [Bacteroidota bacterium]